MAESGRENAGICVDPLQLTYGEKSFGGVQAQDARYFRYAQINDDDGNPRHNTEKNLPGNGELPLAELLDRLPAGIPLSLEAHQPPEYPDTPLEWAKLGLAKTRRFLDGYYASRQTTGPLLPDLGAGTGGAARLG
jgi:sugar phosphate isomerase/epimerase